MFICTDGVLSRFCLSFLAHYYFPLYIFCFVPCFSCNRCLPSISLPVFKDVSQFVTYFFGLLNSIMNNRYAYFIASFKNCWLMLKDRSSHNNVQTIHRDSGAHHRWIHQHIMGPHKK
jgi:hypothetical protein